MRTIFADAETYYDKEYSLKKMTPVEYILDPRFEAIGLAVKEGWPSNNTKPYWVEGPDLPKFFAGIDPNVTSMVTFNALFDMCIFAWRYGFRPRLMVDAMGVSRAVLGSVLRSHSLKSVAAHLGLGVKGDAIHKAEGMHLADLKAHPEFYYDYVQYGLNDVELCEGIYNKLVKGGQFPVSELAVMDMVLRCAVNPKLRLDAHVLAEHLAEIKVQKEMLFAQAALTNNIDGKGDLMSNEKFAQLLRDRGVEPPLKISKLTGRETYAFAKTDKAMVELESHPDPAVQVLVAARVGHKSTQEETRAQRLLNIANLHWPDGIQCKAPIPLRYGAAHTHRLGGEWKLNPQNLGRKSRIRKALVASDGHTVVTGDAAQIEARGVATMCGQDDLIDMFDRGEDVYSTFATEAFGHPVNKKDHPDKRFVGKTSILGLGFQSGWMTLQEALRVQSKLQLGYELKVPDQEAQRYVNVYRSRFPAIPAAWNLLNTVGIDTLAHGGTNFQFGPCVFEKGSILLPSGLRLWYNNLEYRDREWWFTFAEKPEKLYGGKLLENIIQALARIITMDAGVRIQRRLATHAIELALQVHDELGYVVPDEYVPHVKSVMNEEMCRRPVWAPRWPLAAEINAGRTYGDAK